MLLCAAQQIVVAVTVTEAQDSPQVKAFKESSRRETTRQVTTPQNTHIQPPEMQDTNHMHRRVVNTACPIVLLNKTLKLFPGGRKTPRHTPDNSAALLF